MANAPINFWGRRCLPLSPTFSTQPNGASHWKSYARATMDHVSIAVRDMRTAIPFYAETLGARFLFAGERHDQGFRWAQFRFPGGGKVELVTPAFSGGFVERFLDRKGEGVHHVTLKVPDIERA